MGAIQSCLGGQPETRTSAKATGVHYEDKRQISPQSSSSPESPRADQCETANGLAKAKADKPDLELDCMTLHGAADDDASSLGLPYSCFSSGPYHVPVEDPQSLRGLFQSLHDGSPQLEQEVALLLKTVQSTFQAPKVMLVLFEDDKIFVRNGINFARGEFPFRWSFCGWARTKDVPTTLVVPDATKDARFSDNIFVTGAMNVRFYAGAPLMLSEGLAIGTLCFADTKPRSDFTGDQCALLNSLAHLAAKQLVQVQSQAPRATSNVALKRVAQSLECYEACIALVDMQGMPSNWTLMYANERWEATTGTDRMQTVGQRLAMLVEKADAAGAACKPEAEDILRDDSSAHDWHTVLAAVAEGELVEVSGMRFARGKPTRMKLTLRPADAHLMDSALDLPVGVPSYLASSTPSIISTRDCLPSLSSQNDNCSGTWASVDNWASSGTNALSGGTGVGLAWMASRGATPQNPRTAVVPHTGSTMSGAFAMPRPQYCFLTVEPEEEEEEEGECIVEEEEEEEEGTGAGADKQDTVAAAPVSADSTALVPNPAVRPMRTADSAPSCAPLSVMDMVSSSTPGASSLRSLGVKSGGVRRAASTTSATPSKRGQAWGYGSEPMPGLKLTRLLGRGGFGSVYAATYTDPQTGIVSQVAAKVVSNGGVRRALNGVSSEHIFSAEFDHPHILKAYKCVVRFDKPDVPPQHSTCPSQLPQQQSQQGPRRTSRDAQPRQAVRDMMVARVSAMGHGPGRSDSATGKRLPLEGPGPATQPAPAEAAESAGAVAGGADNACMQMSAGASSVALSPFTAPAPDHTPPEGEAGIDFSSPFEEETSAGWNMLDQLGPGPTSLLLGQNPSTATTGANSGAAPHAAGAAVGAGGSAASGPAGASAASARAGGSQGPLAPSAASGETCIMMEYADCGSLQDAIDKGHLRTEPSQLRGRPSMPAILMTAYEIASALEYIHKKSVVHGDLSAQNVLCASVESQRRQQAQFRNAPQGVATDEGYSDRPWVAKVSDLGLSKPIRDPSGGMNTRTVGLITHAAPEVMTQGITTTKADIYSLGVLLWSMYTGTRPWAGLSCAHILAAVTGNGAGLRFSPADMPPRDYRVLAERCLSRDPAHRPSAAEVCEELRRIMANNTCATA